MLITMIQDLTQTEIRFYKIMLNTESHTLLMLEVMLQALKINRADQKYSFIYASVGIHPHDVAEAEDDAIDKLITLSKEEKVVAIGK